MNKLKKAFSLPELIIVVLIVIILGLIAFFTVSRWITKSYDSRKLSDLEHIQKNLMLYNITDGKGFVPMPDNYKKITTMSGDTVLYQGEFGENSISNIKEIPEVIIDPVSNKPYIYSVGWARKKFQVVAIMGTSPKLSLNNGVYAGKDMVKIVGNHNGFAITQTGVNCYFWNMPSLFMDGEILSIGEKQSYIDGESIDNMVDFDNLDVTPLCQYDRKQWYDVFINIIDKYKEKGITSRNVKKKIYNAMGNITKTLPIKLVDQKLLDDHSIVNNDCILEDIGVIILGDDLSEACELNDDGEATSNPTEPTTPTIPECVLDESGEIVFGDGDDTGCTL